MSAARIFRWTASDGIELAWHEVGEGDPVILLHGLFSDAQMNWTKFGHADRIARDGRRVIMPDLRAHGASAKPHEPEAYPPNVLVRDLLELVARLDLDIFDLGGFSLGARTTIEAVTDGLKPRRAVLAGTGLDVLANWDRRARFYLEAIEGFDSFPRGDPHWLAVQFMRTMKIDRVAVAQLLKSVRNHEEKADLIAAFTMPTLVVCGSEDDDNGSAEELAALLPNAIYRQVPGTHMSSVTRPELGEEIARFLAEP